MDRSQTPSSITEPQLHYSDFSDSDSTPIRPQIEELSPSSSPLEKNDTLSPQKQRSVFPIITKADTPSMSVEPKVPPKEHDKESDKEPKEDTTEEKPTYMLFATSKHGRKVSLPIRKGIYRIGNNDRKHVEICLAIRKVNPIHAVLWVDSGNARIVPYESSEVYINETLVPPEGAALTVGLEFTISGAKLMLANPDGSTTTTATKSPKSTFVPSLRSEALSATQTFPFAFRKAGLSSTLSSSSTSSISLTTSTASTSSPFKSKSSNACLVNDEATQFSSFEIIGNNSRSNFPNNEIDTMDTQNTNPISSPDRYNSATKTSRLGFTNADLKRATVADKQRNEEHITLNPPPQKKEKKPPSPPPPQRSHPTSSNEPELENRATKSSEERSGKEKEEEDKIAIYLFGVWALKAVKLSRKYVKVYERHFYQSRYGMSISTIENKVKDFVYKTRSEVCNDFVKIASDSIVVNIGDKALCSLAVKFYTDVSRLFKTKGVEFTHINFDELLSTDDSSFVTIDDFGSSRSNSEGEENDDDDDDDDDVNMDSIIPSESISIVSDASSFSKDPIADSILKSISQEEPKYGIGKMNTVPEPTYRPESSAIAMASREGLALKKVAEESGSKKRTKTGNKGRKQKVIVPPPEPKPEDHESGPIHRSESYEYQIIGVDFMKRKKHAARLRRKFGLSDPLQSELKNQVATESQTSGDEASTRNVTPVKHPQESQLSQLKDEVQPLKISEERQNSSQSQEEPNSLQQKEGSEETEAKDNASLNSSPLPPPSEEIITEIVKSVAPPKPPGRKRGRKRKNPEVTKVNDAIPTSLKPSETTSSNSGMEVEAPPAQNVDSGIVNIEHEQESKDKQEHKETNAENKETEAAQTAESNDHMEVIQAIETESNDSVVQKTEEQSNGDELDVEMEEQQSSEKVEENEGNSQLVNIADTIQESVVDVVMTENLVREENAKGEKDGGNAEPANNDNVIQDQNSMDSPSQDVVFNPTNAESLQTAEANTEFNNDRGYGDLDDIMIPISFLESPQSDKSLSLSLSFDKSTSQVLDLNEPEKEDPNSPSVDDVIAHINSLPGNEEEKKTEDVKDKDVKDEIQKDDEIQNITTNDLSKQEPSDNAPIPACPDPEPEKKPPASQTDTQEDVTMSEPSTEKIDTVNEARNETNTLTTPDNTPQETQKDSHKSEDKANEDSQKDVSIAQDSVNNTAAQSEPVQSKSTPSMSANPIVPEQSQTQEFEILTPITPPDTPTTIESPVAKSGAERQSISSPKTPDTEEDVVMGEPNNEKPEDVINPEDIKSPIDEESNPPPDTNPETSKPSEPENKPHEDVVEPQASATQSVAGSSSSKVTSPEDQVRKEPIDKSSPNAGASSQTQNVLRRSSDLVQTSVPPSNSSNAPTRNNTNSSMNTSQPKAAEKSVSMPITNTSSSNSVARADSQAKSDTTRQSLMRTMTIQPSANPLIPTPGLNLGRNIIDQKIAGSQPQTIINNRGTALLDIALGTNTSSAYIVDNRSNTIVQNPMGSIQQSGMPTYESMDSDQSCDITMDQGSVFSSDETFASTDINAFASNISTEAGYYADPQMQSNGYQNQVYTSAQTFAYPNIYGTDNSGSQVMNYVQQDSGYVATDGGNNITIINNIGSNNNGTVSQNEAFQGNYDYMGMQTQSVVDNDGNAAGSSGQNSLISMEGLSPKLVPQYGNFGMYVNGTQNGLTDCYGNYSGTQAQVGAMCPNTIAPGTMNTQQQQQQQQYLNNQTSQRMEPQNNNHFFPIAPTRK